MAMKWLRKNSKKVMVWIAVPIMVIFLLPFAGRNRNRGAHDDLYGTITYTSGENMELMLSDLTMAHRQLQAIEEYGLKRLSQMGALSMVPDLGGLGPVPTMLTHFIVFGDPLFYNQSNVYSLRSMLYQVAGNWADDDETFKKIAAEIDAVFDADPGESSLLFVLLAQEAHRAGIYASADQVNAIKGIRRMKEVVSMMGPPSTAAVLGRNGLTQKEFDTALGDLISIMLYADMATDSGAITENEIRQTVRDTIDSDQVKGSYVSFRSSFYTEKIGEPTESDLQKLFDSYKSWLAGQRVNKEMSQQNPYGFGYKLPDRVQLDIISFDIVAAEALVKSDFEKLSFVDQEKELQAYWSDNKQNYPDRTNQANQDSKDTQPKFLSFDAAYDRVKSDYFRQQAVERVMRVVGEASQAIQNSEVKPVDYKAIAEKVSTADIKADYQRTEFLTYEKASSLDGSKLGRARLIRSGRQMASVLNVVFNSEPLRDRPAIRLDDPPVKVMEDITSIQTRDYSNKPEKAYIVRLVAADGEREATSIADDGRQGPAEAAPLADGKNDLKDKLAADWKKMQAFEMACAQAEAFAKESAKDWDATLKVYNDKMRKDPNDTWDRLRTDDIQRERDMLQRYQDMMQQNPQASSYYAQSVNRIRSMLKNCAETYRDYEGKPGEVPQYKNYDETTCMVFKELSIDPANKDQYLNYKAATAHQLLSNEQGRLALIHFDPQNIKARSGYVSAHPQTSKEDEPAAADQAEPKAAETGAEQPEKDKPKTDQDPS